MSHEGRKFIHQLHFKLEVGKKRVVWGGPIPFCIVSEIETNIVEKDTFCLIIVCSVFKLLKYDIVF